MAAAVWSALLDATHHQSRASYLSTLTPTPTGAAPSETQHHTIQLITQINTLQLHYPKHTFFSSNQRFSLTLSCQIVFQSVKQQTLTSMASCFTAQQIIPNSENSFQNLISSIKQLFYFAVLFQVMFRESPPLLMSIVYSWECCKCQTNAHFIQFHIQVNRSCSTVIAAIFKHSPTVNPSLTVVSYCCTQLL